MHFECRFNLEGGIEKYDIVLFCFGQEMQERQGHCASKRMTYNHVVECVLDKVWLEVVYKAGHAVVRAPSPCMPEEIRRHDKEPCEAC